MRRAESASVPIVATHGETGAGPCFSAARCRERGADFRVVGTPEPLAVRLLAVTGVPQIAPVFVTSEVSTYSTSDWPVRIRGLRLSMPFQAINCVTPTL